MKKLFFMALLAGAFYTTSAQVPGNFCRYSVQQTIDSWKIYVKLPPGTYIQPPNTSYTVKHYRYTQNSVTSAWAPFTSPQYIGVTGFGNPITSVEVRIRFYDASNTLLMESQGPVTTQCP